MAASSSRNSPGPAQTPFSQPSIAKSQQPPLDGSSGPLVVRQIADQQQIEEAMVNCEIYSGNAVISCFPTDNTVIPQGEWASFVWNSRRPEITQLNKVNIFLFHADSMQQVLSWENVTNPTDRAGVITAQVNDTWWGENGSKWSGSNMSYPYYWVLIRSDETLDGSELPQSTFTAVQTTFADSVIASMSSTSAAAASASSASSASAASASGRPSSVASIQSNMGGSSFPHWAIAVIVILGFFVVSALCLFVFWGLRKLRPRNRASASNRNSMGSASPMMADMGNSPQSPFLAAGPTIHQALSGAHRAPSVVSRDGASATSPDPSTEAGPFSGADAAIMADAFRKALRKPGFPDPVDDESPDSRERKEEELLNRELAEEGTDIQNVGSSRGVKVETLIEQ